MKKMSLLFVLAVIAITIFNFCVADKSQMDLNLYAKSTAIAKVDTVGDMFSITLAPISNKCITAFGIDSLIFDSNSFQYIPDSTKKYGLFSHEVINYFPPNRLAIGFNNGSPICGLNGSKKIFTLYFKTLTTDEVNIKNFMATSIEVWLNGVSIPYKKESAKLSVIFKSMQLFWLNWITRSY